MSRDLAVANESVRCKEKISSYITLQTVSGRLCSEYKVAEIVLLLRDGNYTVVHLKYW